MPTPVLCTKIQRKNKKNKKKKEEGAEGWWILKPIYIDSNG